MVARFLIDELNVVLEEGVVAPKTEAAPPLSATDVRCLWRLHNDPDSRSSTEFANAVGMERIERLINFGLIDPGKDFKRESSAQPMMLMITPVGKRALGELSEEARDEILMEAVKTSDAMKILTRVGERVVEFFPMANKAKLKTFLIQLAHDLDADFGSSSASKVTKVVKGIGKKDE